MPRPFAWHDAWQRLSLNPQPSSVAGRFAATALGSLSIFYGAAVAWRNAGFDRGRRRVARLPCPVISIGNLTIGGTGKTACVELVARKLLARQCRVAVLSRGYGGRAQRYVLRSAGGQLTVDGQPATLLEALADEPQLLARHLEGVPIGVSPQRAAMGLRLCREGGCEAAVLDDGFQHRQLHRDCDIVLINARMPLGGLGCLPRGPLREPLEALKRAHVIIITKADESLGLLATMQEWLQARNPAAAVVTAVHEPGGVLETATGRTLPPAHLAGKRVGLISSIGDPEGFEATARRLHAAVAWHEAYPDHHRYRAADGVRLAAQAGRAPVEALLTTEKDWVRLQPVAATAAWPRPVWVLQVALRVVEGESLLDDRLARVLSR